MGGKTYNLLFILKKLSLHKLTSVCYLESFMLVACPSPHKWITLLFTRFSPKSYLFLVLFQHILSRIIRFPLALRELASCVVAKAHRRVHSQQSQFANSSLKFRKSLNSGAQGIMSCSESYLRQEVIFIVVFKPQISSRAEN